MKYPTHHRDESRLLIIKIQTRLSIRCWMCWTILIRTTFCFNTKVFPAKLYGNKEKTGAKIEVFLLGLNPDQHLWDVLVNPTGKYNWQQTLFGENEGLLRVVIYNFRVTLGFI